MPRSQLKNVSYLGEGEGDGVKHGSDVIPLRPVLSETWQNCYFNCVLSRDRIQQTGLICALHKFSLASIFMNKVHSYNISVCTCFNS